MAGKQEQGKKNLRRLHSLFNLKELKSQLALVTKGKNLHKYTDFQNFKKMCINKKEHKMDHYKNMQ